MVGGTAEAALRPLPTLHTLGCTQGAGGFLSVLIQSLQSRLDAHISFFPSDEENEAPGGGLEVTEVGFELGSI